MPSLAEPSMTSESVSAPTPLRTMLTLTSSVDSLERLLERLDRAGDVGLYDEVEVLGATFAEEFLQRATRTALRKLLPAQSLLGLLGAVARNPLVVDNLEAGPRLRDAGEAKDLDRRPRSCLLDAIAHEVEHRPYPTVGRPCEHGVAFLE